METIKQLKKRAKEVTDENLEEFEKVSDYIFKHPELGLKEEKSSQYLIKKLKENGFKVKENYCNIKTAFRGEYGDNNGPSICFLAEYDALPGYGKNKDENAHACGHNWIAAGTYGAAIVLSKLKDFFKGKIILIGTPAEETLGTKVDLVKKGAFKDIDTVFQMHLGSYTNIGCEALAVDSLKFEFFGKAAHAASFPEDGINALDAVNLTFAGINCLRQHLRSDVRIHGVIRNGGLAPNIVPDYAACEFMIRAKYRKYLDTVTPKIINCAKGAALMTGCKMKYHNVDNSFDELLNLPILQGIMKKNLEDAGVANIHTTTEKGSGSTDIANVSKVVPTQYSELEIKTVENCSVHSEKFLKYVNSKQSYDLLSKSIKSMVWSALEIYTNKKLLSDIKKEFTSITKE